MLVGLFFDTIFFSPQKTGTYSLIHRGINAHPSFCELTK
jgi:hypothetical protein